jgi:hypothetical protein
MGTYTVRIELDSNNYPDFEILHKAMSSSGFSKTIISDEGKEYHLPRAEYNLSTTYNRAEVLNLAENAVARTGKGAEILVTESKARTWSGLKLVK